MTVTTINNLFIVTQQIFLLSVFFFFYSQRKPAVLKGVPLGPCLEKWTVAYLAAKGGDQEVKVHVSSVPQMDFLHKNFIYRYIYMNPGSWLVQAVLSVPRIHLDSVYYD